MIKIRLLISKKIVVKSAILMLENDELDEAFKIISHDFAFAKKNRN